PSLGADMEAGTLVEWLVKPGDEVKRGDIVAVVETDKGAIEVETFQGGVIEALLVQEGTKVPVDTVLASFRGPAEPAPVTAPVTAVAPAPVAQPTVGAKAAGTPAAPAPAPPHRVRVSP